MGNISSAEYPICDCKSTRTAASFARTTRSGSSSGQKLLLAEMMTVAEGVVEQKDRRGKARVRTLSTGDIEKSNVLGSSKNFPKNSYLLRTRNKEEPSGVALKGRYSSVSSEEVKPNASNDHRFTDHEFHLLSMVEGLSLTTVTNRFDVANLEGPRLRETKTSTKCKLKGDDEDIELPKHVLYYGWFFSTETSSVIHAVVMHYFRLCYTQVPQFQRFILTCCKDADVRDPFEYYKRPAKRVKPDDPIQYHVTARFLGREPDPPYQSLVYPFLEKVFRLHLIGLVFTPRTLGVRVKLTPAQQLLFDEKDEIKNGRKQSNSEQPSKVSEIREQVQQEIDGYKALYKRHRKNHPNCKIKTLPSGTEKDGICFKRIHKDPTTAMTTKSRAHITIGCAPKVQAKQTGDDLIDVIDLEQRQATPGNGNFQQDFKLEGGILRQFGKHANAFVLYADTVMIVPCQYNLFI